MNIECVLFFLKRLHYNHIADDFVSFAKRRVWSGLHLLGKERYGPYFCFYCLEVQDWKVKWKLIRDRKNYTTQLTQHWPFASMCTNSMLTQSLLRNQGEVEAECANPSQTVMSFQACDAVGSISTFACFYIRITVVISLNLLTWFQLFLCVTD